MLSNDASRITISSCQHDSLHNSELENPRVIPSKRYAEHSELVTESAHQPCKSRKLKFMKYRIRVDPQTSKYLAEMSQTAYHHFCLGNLSVAATHYEEFLRRRSQWGNSVKEGGHLIIIQAIFNLTRCYLALGQVDKAQIALQELWDTEHSAAISSTHSIFPELATLYFEVTETSIQSRKSTKNPEMLEVQRNLKIVQKRSRTLDGRGNHEAALALISESLKPLALDSFEMDIEMDKDLKELVVELLLSLAEAYGTLGRHAEALLTLEKVWNPTGKIAITSTHRCFKHLANLHWEMKNKLEHKSCI